MPVRTAAIAVFLILVASLVSADAPANVGPDNLAIDGYDPVAYFTDRAPVPGDPDVTYEYGGAVYRFASEANRDTFIAEPDAYLPQYGGYCAWAVSQGYTADVDPEAWIIEDGRLFLNFNRRIGRRFAGDLAGNIEQADRNWIELSR